MVTATFPSRGPGEGDICLAAFPHVEAGIAPQEQAGIWYLGAGALAFLSLLPASDSDKVA